jgi:hypothetical protein
MISSFQVFQLKQYAIFIAVPHAICPACVIFCDLITLMQFSPASFLEMHGLHYMTSHKPVGSLPPVNIAQHRINCELFFPLVTVNYVYFSGLLDIVLNVLTLSHNRYQT